MARAISLHVLYPQAQNQFGTLTGAVAELNEANEASANEATDLAGKITGISPMLSIKDRIELTLSSTFGIVSSARLLSLATSSLMDDADGAQISAWGLPICFFK